MFIDRNAWRRIDDACGVGTREGRGEYLQVVERERKGRGTKDRRGLYGYGRERAIGKLSDLHDAEPVGVPRCRLHGAKTLASASRCSTRQQKR